MPTNILNLPAYSVLAVDESEHDYHVRTEIKKLTVSCPHCKEKNIVGFGRREQLIRDLPMHGRRVGIYVDTRRFRCKACVKTFYEVLPDIDEKRLMTSRLLDWIGKQAVKRTFSSIADEVGVTEGTVRAVFSDYINQLQQTIRFETPRWMGIDEIHLIKPRGVITNIENNTVVELLHNRNKDTVVRYLHHLEGKEQIQYVAMDMWVPYRDAVRAVIPQAQIVIDKFHVLKMANEALEKVRKGLRESLTLKERRGLMHDRFVLLKRAHDLGDKERLLLSGWTKNYDVIGIAYRLKEAFFGIYDAESSDEAAAKYTEWKRGVTPEVAPAFSDLIRAWENWEPYILAYFDHPITNAYTESLNNLIRVMNRLGRGYSFEALRAKILFSEGAHKHKNSRPKFERREKERLIFLPEVPVDLPPLTDEFEPPASKASNSSSTPSTKQKKNYGSDISTLISMIENGEL